MLGTVELFLNNTIGKDYGYQVIGALKFDGATLRKNKGIYGFVYNNDLKRVGRVNLVLQLIF